MTRHSRITHASRPGRPMTRERPRLSENKPEHVLCCAVRIGWSRSTKLILSLMMMMMMTMTAVISAQSIERIEREKLHSLPSFLLTFSPSSLLSSLLLPYYPHLPTHLYSHSPPQPQQADLAKWLMRLIRMPPFFTIISSLRAQVRVL